VQRLPGSEIRGGLLPLQEKDIDPVRGSGMTCEVVLKGNDAGEYR